MQRRVHVLTLFAALVMAWCVAAAEGPVEPPPNKAAAVQWDAGKGTLQLTYHGKVVLQATVTACDTEGKETAAGVTLQPVVSTDKVVSKMDEKVVPGDEKIEQRLKFTLSAPNDGVSLVLRGTVAGSEEAFPAETGGEAQKRFPLVRTSVGLSRSLRNNAVYDRRGDWMIAGPGDGATRVLPKAAGKEETAFAWECRGTRPTGSGQAALDLVFRPRFYQKHLGLTLFEPWTYPVWKGSLTGYCTWWSYRDGISQTTLDAIVDLFAEKKLPDFGYRYVQIDAGYCGGGGGPQSFLEWDKKKFPGGADYAVKKIKSVGMQGGIWVHRVYRSYVDRYLPDIGKQHPDWFVTKEGGKIYQGSFGIWTLNTQNKDAVDQMVRPLFSGLKKQGWDYVKIDGAGDMLYSDREKPAAGHFKRTGSTPEQSLHIWDRVAREELGRNVFILTCWGVGPGRCSIGLADGCRLSSDGFQWNSLVGNSSLNGVVWRGDPDHCDIMATGAKDKTTMKTSAQPAAMADTIDQPCVVSMAGSMLMVSDKFEDYKNDSNLEGMKRSAPVLFTVPGQLYDGGGDGTWWLQEIDRPFVLWSVLALFNWRKGNLKWARPNAPETEVKFADLGLADDREYLVFEFWSQAFLGKSKGSFTATPVGALDHPPHLAGRRRSAGRTLGCRKQDPVRQERRGRRRSIRADRASPAGLPTQERRGRGREGRDRESDGNRHGPYRADRHQDRGVEDDLRGMNMRLLAAYLLVLSAAAFAADAAPDWQMGPFVKHPQPVLSPTPDSRFQCPVLGKEVRWEEQNVYNPAAVVRDSKVYLLYRADDRNPALKWGRTCRIGMATSDDGIHFARHPTPVLYPDNDEWKKHEWEGGCEDLHIVEGEDGVYYMNYTTWSGKGDTMSVATSRDLVHWTKHGPAFRKAAPDKVPGSRTGVVVSRREGDRLIATKINGKYWMYYTHPCALAWSDNLIDWTPTGKAVWGGSHEAGAVALLREDGILLMTQGEHHSLGAWTLRQALIDRDNLKTVLKEPKEPFLWPEHEWEKKGMTGNTTVANGLVPFKGQWLLYYGAADTVIGLATCPTAK
ncbi:MAG: alpha-galactosidase [Planctomycetota bacterium]|nr:alpha-galactosidase [Planctomycetota bacterium]